MAKCRLNLVTKNGSIFSYTDCISFYFEKEMYTPYTKAGGVFYTKNILNMPSASLIKTVTLWINDEKRHIGLADEVRITRKNGYSNIEFSSRGYTLLLGQNEPYPEINSNVNLQSLLAKNITCSKITCEADTPVVNYIYVKEKSTIWDAVTAYSLKAGGKYPYIRGANKVMSTMNGTTSFNYADEIICDKTEGINTTLLLSCVNMADLNGEYTYTKSSSDADAFDIIRKKYYALDRQWLYDPEMGLTAKLDFSERGVMSESFTYIGSMGEDLMDRIIQSPISDGMRINALRIYGSSKGMFTKIICYNDKYGQKI